MEFAPNPAPVAALAHGAQIVTADIDVTAALSVTTRGNNSAASPRALKPSIVIYDFANAAVIVID
jgi:hypothetical protein